MKFNKPKYWDSKNSLLPILFFPFSLIVLAIIFLKKKITIPETFDIPVICLGNIYVGGTGKTPASIFVAKELSKLGKKPVILRKFYKSHVDEHVLIKNEFNNLILNKNRNIGLKIAKKKDYDTVILDDGFQDYKVKKNLNIICFNQNQLIGNGFVIPSGPLRNSLSSLQAANIILINGNKDEKFEKKILKINKNLKIFYSNYKPLNLDDFKGKKLLALAGIGNPKNFFQLIEKHGLKIEKKMSFPDHYEFNKKEIDNIKLEAKNKNYQIITTEKDYIKIKEFDDNQIKCLKVLLDINESDKFLAEITKIYD